MLDALTITEAEAAGLSELAALDLAMARDFAARAQAAEDPETASDLARSYQRMARSYRQSLALKVRLQAEMQRAAREAPPPVPRPDFPTEGRTQAVRQAVQRVIWAEHEPTEAEAPEADAACDRLFDELEERLRRLSLDNHFGLAPLDDQVRAVCRALGLDETLARRWRDLPNPEDTFLDPPPGPAAPPPWRASG